MAAKLNATTAQIEAAVQSFGSTADSGTLWISFASAAGYNSSTETIFPKVRQHHIAVNILSPVQKMMFYPLSTLPLSDLSQPTAIGDGTLDGVNQKLYTWLQNLATTGSGTLGHQIAPAGRKRVGAVLLDFFAVDGLVPLIIQFNDYYQ